MNKTQHKYVRDFIMSYGFTVLPLTENIGHRAAIYIEEYTISSGLRSGDAVIAASNAKHFKAIKDLKFKLFKP